MGARATWAQGTTPRHGRPDVVPANGETDPSVRGATAPEGGLMYRDVIRTRPVFGSRRIAGTVAAVGLLTGLLVGPAVALAGTIGGQLFWNGGTVTVEVQYADAGFNSKLYLYPDYTDAAPDFFGKIFIADNCNTSPAACAGLPPITVTVPPSLTAGDELVFGIEVLQTGQRFLMGPGTRNPDGLAHAIVTPIGTSGAQVGFEDLLNG